MREMLIRGRGRCSEGTTPDGIPTHEKLQYSSRVEDTLIYGQHGWRLIFWQEKKKERAEIGKENIAKA